MMKTKGLLVVISGFSGAGKGSLIRELRKRYDNYRLSVSATTRQPRTVDIPGETYFFLTRDEFEKMISGNGFLEYAQYNNNYYGTPRAYVEQQLQEGRDVLLEIEVQGAMQFKKKFPETFLIFVATKSAAEMERRLTGRGTEDFDKITGRLKAAIGEAEQMPHYDCVVINDDLQTCVDQTNRIILGEETGPAYDPVFKEQFVEGLKEIVARRTAERI